MLCEVDVPPPIKAMVAEPTTETSAQLWMLSGFQGSFVGHLTQKAS